MEVYIGGLNRLTLQAIGAYMDGLGWSDYSNRTYWELENFCALYFRLKHEPDTTDLFPCGKSATLQHMELLIEKAVLDEQKQRS